MNVIDGEADGTLLDSLTNFTAVPVNFSGNVTFKDNIAFPKLSIMQYDNKALVFDNLKANAASQPKKITITNKGDGDLILGDIKITGVNSSEFKLTAPATANKVIKKDGSLIMTVIFKPISTGVKSAVLSIANNDPKQKEVKIDLSGTCNLKSNGVVISLSTKALNFDLLTVKSVSKEKTIVIKNTGKVSLKIKSVAITGDNAKDFVINTKNSANKVVAPSKSVTLTVKFAPKSAGKKNATITIVSNDNINSKVKVQLTGTAK